MAVTTRPYWEQKFGCVCGCVSGCVGVCRAQFFGIRSHLGNMVATGYNELACLRGCAASLLHHAQEHGKANTELISKTSKGGHFLPKTTRTCPSVSVSLSSLHPQYETFLLVSHLERATAALLPSVLAGARCKSSWHYLS